MRVLVRLYGGLRGYTSSNLLQLDLQDGATVADVMAQLNLRPGEVWLATLDDQLVETNHLLRSDDALSLIPPVGGG
jgi:molybdopterin converting factor small subunit